MEKEVFDNVINNILSAEKQADNIIETAKNEAQSIQNETARTIANIEKQNLIDVKAAREKILGDAEKTATANYDSAIKKAKADADTMIATASKNIPSIANEILRSVID